MEILVFHLIVGLLLTIDLRLNHIMTTQSSIRWTLIWIAVASAFGAWVWLTHGADAGSEYFAAYLIEKSMSVDNLFVFILIFRSFHMMPSQQHRLLIFGILGAIILRGSLILLGTGLIERFHLLLYLFGAFLVWTAIKMLWAGDDEPEQPFGVWFFTPFINCLITIEVCDLLFAFDSIPATFAITQNAFVAYTANIFAILGLRSLFFAVSSFLNQFENLKYGISAVLAFVGLKILLESVIEISTPISLAVIFLVLTAAIVTSKKGESQHV